MPNRSQLSRSRITRPCLKLVLVSSIVMCGQAGCQIVQPIKTFTSETRRALKPRPFDYYESGQETDDDWDSIASEARSFRPVEKEPDPLWKHLASKRALSIERSVSIEQ